MALSYLSVVRLRDHAARAINVRSDAVGVIVDVYGDGTFEVEFSDARDGATIALLTLPEDQIEPVEQRTPVSARPFAE